MKQTCWNTILGNAVAQLFWKIISVNLLGWAPLKHIIGELYWAIIWATWLGNYRRKRLRCTVLGGLLGSWTLMPGDSLAAFSWKTLQEDPESCKMSSEPLPWENIRSYLWILLGSSLAEFSETNRLEHSLGEFIGECVRSNPWKPFLAYFCLGSVSESYIGNSLRLTTPRTTKITFLQKIQFGLQFVM